MEYCHHASTREKDRLTLFSVLGAAVTSGIVAYALARFLSIRLKRMGISGVDVHKPDAPETAEMGGLSVLLAMLAGVPVLLILGFHLESPLILLLITVALVGCVGIVDDVIGLRHRVKPSLVALASLPMMYLLQGRISVKLPIVGTVPLGLLYPLIVVPLSISTCANFTNLLAGFNGLEAGIAVIGLSTISTLAWMNGAVQVAALGFVISAAYLGFLVMNWYPAKIFPGDTGTLVSGAAIAAIGLAAGAETAVIILSIPAAMDFALKLLSKRPFQGRKDLGNSRVDSKGILTPPPYQALAHAFMRIDSLSEVRLVMSILAMQAFYAGLGAYVQLSVI